MNKPRHAFNGERVDMQVVCDQASARMVDKREPESTIVHWHKSNQVCDKDSEHKIYDHLIGTIAAYPVGIDLPDEYKTKPEAPKPAMSDNWFKTSSG